MWKAWTDKCLPLFLCMPISFYDRQDLSQYEDKPRYVHVKFKRISLCFFLLPLINVVLIAAVYSRNKKVEIERNGLEYDECLRALRIFRIAEIAGLIYYGWFTCQVYLARKQFMRDFTKLTRECIGKIMDQSQMIIMVTQKWQDLKWFNKIVGWWLCVAISMAALLFATYFKWLFSVEYDYIDGKEIRKLVSRATGCQNSMLLLQPLFAVGGYGVCHVWDFFQDEFKKRICESTDSQNHVMALQKVIKYMQLIRSGPWLFTMFVGLVLTLFVAMALPPQNVDFWLRPGCDTLLVSTDLPNTTYVEG